MISALLALIAPPLSLGHIAGMHEHRGPLFHILVGVSTLAVLTAYGMYLRWGFDSGNWWWTLPLGLSATAWVAYLVWTPEDTEGAKDVWTQVKGWFGR